MAKYILTNKFEKTGDFYVAKQKVETTAFAVCLYSDEEGNYQVWQQTDPDAPRPARTENFNYRTEMDYHYQGAITGVEVTIKSSVPVSYCSIIEAE